MNQALRRPLFFATIHRLEWRTWLVAGAVYGGWGLVTWHAAALPWWALLALGAWFVGWHNSLQHETVHGHPSRARWVNGALGMPALGLWIPYTVYRDHHLAHHRTPELTSPSDDPESFYFEAERWRGMGPVLRTLYAFNQTLLGRVSIGPALAAAATWHGELRRLGAGERDAARAWLGHAASVAAVLAWVVVVCRIPLWAYVALFAYPGLSLTLVRSYLEHRPAAQSEHRTAIVEGGAVAGLLYLNNNLHFCTTRGRTCPGTRCPPPTAAARFAGGAERGLPVLRLRRGGAALLVAAQGFSASPPVPSRALRGPRRALDFAIRVLPQRPP